MNDRDLLDLGGVPVNRMAWRVVQPGEHYERPEKLTELCFAVCPRREQVNAARVERKKRGESFGLRSSNGRADQLWVCRCLCGLFTIRTAKSLMKIKPPEIADLMRCEACTGGNANAWRDKQRGRNFERAPKPY